MREDDGSGARPLSLRDSRSSLQDLKVGLGPDGVVAPRHCSCRSSRPPCAGRGNSPLLFSNLQRVDLRLTHRLRGNLKIGKEDFKATSDLERLSVI